MERKRILMGVVFLVAALVLAGAVGLTLAQGPGEDDDVLPQGDVGVATSLDDVIPIQGRLLDRNGNPINGTRTIVMTLYDAATGGTALCSDSDNVTAVNGLFNAYMDWCEASDLNGRQVWLGIKVGSDAEMTPRQKIYAVPYAWSLRPGAVISETSTGAILNVFNHGSGWGLDAYSKGHDAVHGRSDANNHAGVSGENSGGGIGVYAWSEGAGLSGPAMKAEAGGASGIALHADANSSDASVVIHNRGTGLLLKGFGGDGGEDEIRINNNGSIETKADSYIFIPGTQIIKNLSSDTTRWDVYANGSVRIWRGSEPGSKTVYLSIVLPAVLYGQPVDVESITVYYKCEDGSKAYISSTYLTKQTKADSWVTLVSNLTDHKSTTATSYTLAVNNVLSASQGILGLYFNLYFADDSTYIQLGGVRIQLGHHHLY
ncbi:MAG: hypothetical protein H5T65_01915 [Chloroflexi bacterium]|nr:hypothetical protein [Chloroflexota bacterium]